MHISLTCRKKVSQCCMPLRLRGHGCKEVWSFFIYCPQYDNSTVTIMIVIFAGRDILSSLPAGASVSISIVFVTSNGQHWCNCAHDQYQYD